jgi:hypothetical protein
MVALTRSAGLVGTPTPSSRRCGWFRPGDGDGAYGGLAWYLGTGVRGGTTHPATRTAAIADLIADVHNAWTNLR